MFLCTELMHFQSMPLERDECECWQVDAAIGNGSGIQVPETSAKAVVRVAARLVPH